MRTAPHYSIPQTETPGQKPLWTETLPEHSPPRTETPLDRDPPGQRPPDKDPPGQRPPGQRPPGQRTSPPWRLKWKTKTQVLHNVNLGINHDQSIWSSLLTSSPFQRLLWFFLYLKHRNDCAQNHINIYFIRWSDKISSICNGYQYDIAHSHSDVYG